MTPHEPPAVAMLAARIAKAFPSLSAYSAASLATELCRIERAQHRHAERCCSGAPDSRRRERGEVVGYCRLRKLRENEPVYHGAPTGMAWEHDPEAEERAGLRVGRAINRWHTRLRVLLIGEDVDPLTLQRYWQDTAPSIERQHDPRGRVLLVRLPGEAEPAGV